ncbi:MAG: ATP-binding cassette domain-containing protein, partial [Xanthomonadales bacterium]|nr:ATP-binding cassette domain-containing protein [Xanthomonadales bacterium]
RHALCAGTLWLGHLLALKGDLTVRENLHYNLAIGDEDDAVDVESLCTDLGLAGYEDTPTRALSAGQRKRAALARLAASRRSLWLLDEPFANLDGPGMAVVERLLEAHLARGGGAMLTSHGVLPITLPATTVRLEHPR